VKYVKGKVRVQVAMECPLFLMEVIVYVHRISTWILSTAIAQSAPWNAMNVQVRTVSPALVVMIQLCSPNLTLPPRLVPASAMTDSIWTQLTVVVPPAKLTACNVQALLLLNVLAAPEALAWHLTLLVNVAWDITGLRLQRPANLVWLRVKPAEMAKPVHRVTV
jgi:hypothetical protein